MTSRDHVEAALIRLLRRPGRWPTADLNIFRNLLLDEVGGDHRALVEFLVQLAVIGVPRLLEQAAESGEAWPSARSRIALFVATDRFLQTDAVRWGVGAWGRSLGIAGAERPDPPPSTAASNSPAMGAAPGSTAPSPRQSVARLPRPPIVASPPTVARAPAGPRSSRPAPHATLPSSTGWERYAFSSITMMLIVAIMLMWFTRASTRAETRSTTVAPESVRSSGESADAAAPSGSDPGRTVVGGDSVFTASADTITGRIERLGIGTLRLRNSTSTEIREVALSEVNAVVLQGGVRLDRRALLQAATITDDSSAISRESARSLAGAYVLRAQRESVTGEERCDSVGRAIDWNQQTLETIAISDDGTSFSFGTRPGIAGRIGTDGSFESHLRRVERDGTRYAFRLKGRPTPRGFVAVGETWTETTLRWRQTIRCRFVATLVATRLH